ncbi:MAG: lactate utilization protein C [Gammaproteobacteria bacterium]|nr:lactate utilization protein C [Gammaproteobacteria bacterium]MCY4217747.1 lactate utilization protein C [Gammaproteobacteria bacterium]MCY4276124.1 lactate utilization protein C [Gammaproteobacteria bacterium]
MSDSREKVLNNIRRALNRTAQSPLSDSPPSALHPRYRTPLSKDLIQQFSLMHTRVQGTFEGVDSLQDVPLAAHRYLVGQSVSPEVVISPSPELTSINWKGLKVEFRVANRKDRSSVTMAFAGIAETGTLVMVSSKQSPINHHFLPEFNIAVLKQSKLVDCMENLWPLIGEHPRTINLITGPSKTADIEQTIVYGAHGPRALHVILVRSTC